MGTVKYKISLYACRAYLPFFFAIHPWFVVENSGAISRWAVSYTSKSGAGLNWGHLRKNHSPPFRGIGIIPSAKKYFWQPKLLGSIEGDEGSVAQSISEFIQNSSNIYPYRNQYSLFGPNSNTYVQWALNSFPEFKIKLPWNAFGKNYHV